MTDIREIIDAQRRLDDLSGASKVQKILQEMKDTYAFREAKQHMNESFGMNHIRKALFEENRHIIEQHRSFLETIAGYPFSNSYQQLLGDAQQSMRRLYSDNFREIEGITGQNLKSLVGDIFSQFPRDVVGTNVKNIFDQLRQSLQNPFQTQNSELARSYEQAIKAATLSSVGAFSKVLLETEHLRNKKLVEQFSSSLLGYDNFANQTLAQLRVVANKSIAPSLKGSLILANEQILRSTSAIQSYIENSNISEIDGSSSFFNREIPRVNRYRVQKQELLRRNDVEEDEDYESLIVKSPSAISFEQISNCMMLIGLCNEASETTKGNTIFTITSTLWLSAWKLTGVVPTNKDSFAIIVDCLYLMLYEGAGKDKLRFIEQGYIEATEAELIWKIKHLRNKWLRHDIDHGKETDIRKSHQHRKEALEWFGLGKVPYSKDEFIFLYNSLMLRVEEFLKLLLERVSKFTN